MSSPFILRAVATALLTLAAFPLSAQPSEPSRPNIVLIMADDLGWKDTGFMGSRYFETPRLDALADDSLVFTNAYASAANCAPSRACLMSGLQTPVHGVYTVGSSERGDPATRRIVPTTNRPFLDLGFLTLAEALNSAGYETMHLGKWHIGQDPLDQGFDHNVAGFQAGHPPDGYFSPYKNPKLVDGPDGEYLTDRLTSEAIALLRRRDTSKPFFLYLPYYAVHTPIQGKPELVAKYREKGPTDGIDSPEYAAMVENLDTNIGRLLDYLDEESLSRDTLLIFTSDNGGIRAIATQAPLRGGKGSYYEGGIRVPLTVRWPGRIEPGRSDQPVTNLDFYPTFVELLGLQTDLPFDGDSLAEVWLEGASIPKRPLVWHFPIYLQAYRPGLDDGRDPLFRTRPGSAIRLGRWKLHHYFEDDALELYDLEADPGERRNVAETYPLIRDNLYNRLETWRQEHAAPIPLEPNPAYDPATAEKVLQPSP